MSVLSYSQKAQSLDEIIAENKGKVVLVDYWASWCAPCRVAMQHMPRLKERYKGKDVVFVFITTDTEYDKWNEANVKEGLDTEKYNLIWGGMKKSVRYKFEVTQIPKYLIFDKDGELVNEDAPTEVKKLVKIIDKYLSK
jgi:thiol-disulfide isomerase/thioredoxin